MTLTLDEILSTCQSVLERETSLKDALLEPLKGGAFLGGGAFIGSLALGPVGFAIGAFLGFGCAFYRYRKMQSLWTVFRDMSHQKRARLERDLLQLLRQFEITDALRLALVIADPGSALRSAILNKLSDAAN